jgi:hypothetical protein
VKLNINSVEVHPQHNWVITGMECMMNWWVLVDPKLSSFVTKKLINFVPFSAMGQKTRVGKHVNN